VLDALKAALALLDHFVQDSLSHVNIRMPDPFGVPRGELAGLGKGLGPAPQPVVEEHVREVEPGNVNRTLAGVKRVWRAIESGVFYPAPSTPLPGPARRRTE